MSSIEASLLEHIDCIGGMDGHIQPRRLDADHGEWEARFPCGGVVPFPETLPPGGWLAHVKIKHITNIIEGEHQ